jgi:hypothetical protein
MNDAGEKSLHEMGIISSPSIDISDLVESSRNTVRGKSTIDALFAFSNIYEGEKIAKIRESSEKTLRKFPLQALFASTHLSRDGRVIAKQPGFGFGDAVSDEYQTALWAKMIRSYQMQMSLIVQGIIWPAFEILLLEHRLRVEDFVALAVNSPIVPKGREQLFGKALFAGYEKDFVTAIHILVPQIENLVRQQLKNAGKITTNLDKDSIENENGLSTLMDIPETTQIFGEDLAFEIKALFCDAFGPNLRNEIAHGLLDDANCQSMEAIYAWWFGLKLVFKTFWNARRITDTEITS